MTFGARWSLGWRWRRGWPRKRAVSGIVGIGDHERIRIECRDFRRVGKLAGFPGRIGQRGGDQLAHGERPRDLNRTQAHEAGAVVDGNLPDIGLALDKARGIGRVALIQVEEQRAAATALEHAVDGQSAVLIDGVGKKGNALNGGVVGTDQVSAQQDAKTGIQVHRVADDRIVVGVGGSGVVVHVDAIGPVAGDRVSIARGGSAHRVVHAASEIITPLNPLPKRNASFVRANVVTLKDVSVAADW